MPIYKGEPKRRVREITASLKGEMGERKKNVEEIRIGLHLQKKKKGLNAHTGSSRGRTGFFVIGAGWDLKIRISEQYTVRTQKDHRP